MSETWVVVLIYPKKPQLWWNVLLDFIKPTVEELERQDLLMTFHFFFEPEIHFRVRPKNDNQVSQIESLIKNRLTEVQKLIRKADFSQYSGEEPDFGIEGWQLAQKYFEYCCRISLLNLEVLARRKTPQDIGNQFNVGKFVHCFLNQIGMDVNQEASFHNDRNIERRLMSLGIFQRLDQIESILKKLENLPIKKQNKKKEGI